MKISHLKFAFTYHNYCQLDRHLFNFSNFSAKVTLQALLPTFYSLVGE